MGRRLGPIEQGYYRWRAGDLDDEGCLRWFQRLADTGWGWRYPRDVGVELCSLIVAGLVSYPEDRPIPHWALENCR